MEKILLNNTHSRIYISGNKICIFLELPELKYVSGGTATDVQLVKYNYIQRNKLKIEIISEGLLTEEELRTAAMLNITGTQPGTVIFDVSEFGDVGDPIKIIHKKTNGWETLYDGTIPSSNNVTITLTEFSPIVCTLLQGNLLLTAANEVLQDINNNNLECGGE